MLGHGFEVAALTGRAAPSGAPTTEPDWPDGAVALWLIFGQSNAEGYAPYTQDPARQDPSDAVPALTAAERRLHPWVRFSTRGSVSDAGRFVAVQGLATASAPRTSGKVWTDGALGIPPGTPSFGPEIGLVRHVLSGSAPESWRDDAEPRLWVFKQVEGGKSVDHFRWGGAGQSLVLDALRQSAGETLGSLSATRQVFVQGMIFVIGEKDARDDHPAGGSMASTLAPRFADWVRQLRAALGGTPPALFVEIHDALDARKRDANTALGALAESIPNAAVLTREPEWTHVGDDVHYDAQGQDRIGAAAFRHFREVHGRPGDGLVLSHPFTGLKPWFHVPPLFVDDGGDRMRLAATAAMDGTLHAVVTAAGSPQPSAAAIRSASSGPSGFSRQMTADQQAVWYSPPGVFLRNVTQDLHVVLESPEGALGEQAVSVRSQGARFGPDLALQETRPGGAVLSVRPTFAGTLFWALYEGERDWIAPDDVEAAAFRPVQVGTRDCSVNEAIEFDVSGLAAGVPHTFLLTGRRDNDGARAVTQRAVFTTL